MKRHLVALRHARLEMQLETIVALFPKFLYNILGSF